MTYSIADYENRYANQIAEANSKGNYDTEKIIANAIRLSRVATDKDFSDFKETFKDYDHGLGSWKKWGGGNKMGSGGAAVNAARKARAEANAASRGPGLGFHLGQMARGITARFSPTQGQHPTSAEGFGYSNHSRKNSYNTHGVGERSDGSRGPVSSSSSPRSRKFAMSFSVPSNLQSLYSGSFNIAGGPDPNRGLNRGATYGRDGEKTSITTDSDFGIRMRNQVLADMARFKA
tara:strand:+ start:24279 stop:24980 length:702 start_codon:yes stop_codon:yes gene_type:complete